MNPRGDTPSHDWLILFWKTTRAKELENELFAIRLTPDAWAARATGHPMFRIQLWRVLSASVYPSDEGLLLPLGFTDGSTLLHWWSKQSGGDS